MHIATMSSQLLNKTDSSGKVDCAKECPCGVPVIPVPDQWLEVMVTGGFKVWHIIFIIIAFIVTMTVVYCCFHRCRIPRTKQEIEADLMRSNLTTKFRDYLQEIPNEPTSFVEALKKVQELEEKMEQDDAKMSRELGARKRMGWLKLKGKDDKDANASDATKTNLESTNVEATVDENLPPNTTSISDKPPEPAPVDAAPEVVPVVTNEEVVPKSVEASQIEQDQKNPDEKSTRQPRRRRQKPNLHRTKRTRERSHGEPEPDKPATEDKPEAPVTSHRHHSHRSHQVSSKKVIPDGIP